jgi:UDP-3-O-[3-hydroxymyristoyl] glucosamine N-acyltransferase
MFLSEVVDGIEGKLVRDGEFATLEYCTGSLEQKFLTFMGNAKFIDQISQYASCVLCSEELFPMLPEYIEGVFVTASPKDAFQRIHNKLKTDSRYQLPVTVNKIGQDCAISETAVIANDSVEIGDRVVIEDHVRIYDHVKIGDDCIIRSGAVLGGKAFTFARTTDGVLSMEDMGRVELGDRVEIFSLSHVAKGILPTDVTHIGNDVKIDAGVYVGHGDVIGDRTLIAGGSVIAGNVTIGADSWVGVNATVSNRIRIGEKARVSLGSVVTKDVKDGETVTGNFAIEHGAFIRELKAKGD